MADRRDDARGKKIVFVSSCLLNTNNKVKGLARYSGMCREVFDTLCDNGLGIQQMDCPETLYLGIQRWWYTKNLYDCRASGITAGNWRSVLSPIWKSTPGRATRWWPSSAATAPPPAA